MTQTVGAPTEIPAPPRNDLLVVGVGGSAGGIQALKELFGAAQPEGGIAYVVILHLSPEHDSSLAEVLQSNSSLPVRQVRERMRIEADHVYVVPPNRKLAMKDGWLEVSDLVGSEERRAPIDMFFRTLADSCQTSAVTVVLSGTGADGSMGMKRVKEFGGLCIAQAPAEAEFADMPRSAIATGLVDYVLPANQVAARIGAYRRHIGEVERPIQDEGGQVDQALVDIFTQLRSRTGHDFSNYKRSTVLRRIERRMSVHQLAYLSEYAAFVRDNREEPFALLGDLLISVTNFFRDPEAFAAFEKKVVPKLFEGKGPEGHVRVWIAGCATGEEAYSIAMLLAEHSRDRLGGPTVQVFATDIDERALAKARAGLYTVNDAADVSPERLRRFFTREGDAFRVQRELREMVLFAAHNVVKDPPFSHLDLVSCRNLLIYLNRAAQERILKLFHFGLNPGGMLFLGTSESAEEIANLFVAVDKESHVYQSRGVETPLATPLVTASPVPIERAPGPSVEHRLRERLSYQDLHQRLLEQYAAPSVIVNAEHEILHLSERAGRYLTFVGGEPSQNLLKVVRPELRLELHSALYQAVQQRSAVVTTAGPVALDGVGQSVKIVVNPVFSEGDPSRGLILVLFEPAEGSSVSQPVAEGTLQGEPMARQLEEELVGVKLRLRTTIEKHELQQEELKASNEELQAMNEELRSSSEELETSKEELQSLNEELTTVNQELKIKIDELSHANNDTRNLMNSTDLATVFVDRSMRIKLFTPRARTLFNLIPADAGRPLLDITHRLDYPQMVADIERVLDTLAVGEREVGAPDDHWYIARLLPYRTAEDRIAGVVLTFTDITERKRAELAIRESEEYVRLVMESVSEYAIFTLDLGGRVQSWNPGAQQLFGYGQEEMKGNSAELLFTPEDRAAGVPQEEMRQAREAGRALDERWHLRKDGTRFFASGVMAPLKRFGMLVGYTKVARDLTRRARADEEARMARDDLEARVLERTAELAQVNDDLRREMTDRIRSEEERVHLLRRLVNVQEAERRRISREMHDQHGQEVAALGVSLALLRKSPGIDATANDRLERFEQIVRRLDSHIDFLVWELRPTGLDDLGLAEALADYVSGWSRRFGVKAEFESRLEGRLDPDTETALYRIAQEALNNINKHAKARRVSVALVPEGENVRLVVTDDGNGFDPEVPLREGKSLGLVSMRERAALVSGTTAVESGAGRGTRIVVKVPRT